LPTHSVQVDAEIVCKNRVGILHFAYQFAHVWISLEQRT
jgi:hypothetical protein